MLKCDRSLDYFDYRLNLEIYKRLSLQRKDKIEILEEIFPILAQVKNSITLGDLLRKLSQRLDLDEEMIRGGFREFKKEYVEKQKED